MGNALCCETSEPRATEEEQRAMLNQINQKSSLRLKKKKNNQSLLTDSTQYESNISKTNNSQKMKGHPNYQYPSEIEATVQNSYSLQDQKPINLQQIPYGKVLAQNLSKRTEGSYYNNDRFHYDEYTSYSLSQAESSHQNYLVRPQSSSKSIDTQFQSFANSEDSIERLSREQQPRISIENNLEPNGSNDFIQEMVDSSDLLWGSDVLDEDKFQLVLQCFKIELEDRKQDEWKQTYNQDNIYKIYRNKNQKNKVRAEYIAQNISVSEVFQKLFDKQQRIQWDSSLAEFTNVKKINENQDVIYLIRKNKKGLSDRDYLVRRFIRQDFPTKGDLVLVEYSIEHHDYPQDNDKIVRGDCQFNGYIIQQNQQNVKINQTCHINFNGDIPSFLANSLYDRTVKDQITDLLDFMDQSI